MGSSTQQKLREQLLTGTGGKADKTPPVADGILSVTPDSGDIVQWRSTSVLDAAETSSSYLDEDDDGGGSSRGGATHAPAPHGPPAVPQPLQPHPWHSGAAPRPHAPLHRP